MNSLRISIVAIALVTGLVAGAKLIRTPPNAPETSDIRNTTVDVPVVIRTNGGLLEVSTITSTEGFESSSSHSIFGIPLGKTVSHIRAPAVFRYHVELAREWTILLRDKTFIVVAPTVKPSLPVAIDTAHLEKDSFGVWSVATGGAQLDQLQRSMTGTLAMKAASSSYVQLQREAARQTVAEFVAKWLITQEQWKSASKYPIRVSLADDSLEVLSVVSRPFTRSIP